MKRNARTLIYQKIHFFVQMWNCNNFRTNRIIQSIFRICINKTIANPWGCDDAFRHLEEHVESSIDSLLLILTWFFLLSRIAGFNYWLVVTQNKEGAFAGNDNHFSRISPMNAFRHYVDSPNQLLLLPVVQTDESVRFYRQQKSAENSFRGKRGAKKGSLFKSPKELYTRSGEEKRGESGGGEGREERVGKRDERGRKGRSESERREKRE